MTVTPQVMTKDDVLTALNYFRLVTNNPEVFIETEGSSFCLIDPQPSKLHRGTCFTKVAVLGNSHTATYDKLMILIEAQNILKSVTR